MTLAILDTAGNLHLHTKVLECKWTVVDGYRYLYFKLLIEDPCDGSIRPVRTMFPSVSIKTLRMVD